MSAPRYEALSDPTNSQFFWRFVDDDEVVFRGPDVATAALALAGAQAARAAVIAAIVPPTPGNFVSILQAAAMNEAGAAPIQDLTAGVGVTTD